MSRTALTLASRFQDQPQIADFLRYCSRLSAAEASTTLSLPRTRFLLDELDAVGIRLLIEIIDETRVRLEGDQLYQEAAYWDLIADRVRHELKHRE